MEKIGDLKLPLPSLIILKNSIVSGAIPKPKDLEIGEVALTLANNEEGIWVKNSKGEVKNLSRPNKTLLWGDIFKVFPDKSSLEKAIEDGEVSEDSICFVTKESLIWTKGEYYASSYNPSDLEKIVSQRLITIPKEVWLLDPNSCSSEDIEKAWGGLENFKDIAINANNESVLSALKTTNGTVPVSIITEIISNDDITLKLEWILDGNYYSETFLWKDEVFGIQKIKSPLDGNAKVGDIEDRLESVESSLCWIEAN